MMIKKTNLITHSILHICNKIESCMNDLNNIIKGVCYSSIIDWSAYKYSNIDIPIEELEHIIYHDERFKKLVNYFKELGYGVNYIPDDHKGNLVVVHLTDDNFMNWMLENEHTIDAIIYSKE